MNRREFLRVSALGTGGLVMGISFAGCANVNVNRMKDTFAASNAFRPNAFITVTPSNEVFVASGFSEMGQGVFMVQSTLVAEELDMPIENVKPYNEIAGPDFHLALPGIQATGGSTSARTLYMPMRQGAATARAMFISAAAKQWNCPTSECSTANGNVVHVSGKVLPYGDLVAVAVNEEIPEEVPLKDPSEFKYLGKSRARVDITEKVTGAPIFGIDAEVPNMLKAFVVRPEVFGAEVDSVELNGANDERGVVDVITLRTGVAVVAEKYWQAMRAAKKLNVSWKSSKMEGFNTDTVMQKMVAQTKERPGVIARNDGKFRSAERDAKRVVEAVYEAPYVAHAPLEPQNAIVFAQKEKVDIWAPVQVQSEVQTTVAKLAGVSKENVNVHTTFLGGAFGRRLVSEFVVEALMLSMKTNRPVQVIYSREHDMKGGFYRPIAAANMKATLNGNQVSGFHLHNVSQSPFQLSDFMEGAMPTFLPTMTKMMMGRMADNLFISGSVPDATALEGVVDMTYDIPNIEGGHTRAHSPVTTNSWRSVGHSFNAFFIESFFDEIAHALKEDPVDLRRRLLKNDDYKLGVMDRVVEMSKWSEPSEAGYAKGIAVHKSFDSYCAEVVEAGVFDGEIRIKNVWCAIDCGLALNPDIVRQQMEGGIIFGLSAALFQKITFESGQIQQGNFDSFPLMRMFETPNIEVSIVDSGKEVTGVGEPGLPPAAPALANAIFAATGKRLRKMPFYDALKELS